MVVHHPRRLLASLFTAVCLLGTWGARLPHTQAMRTPQAPARACALSPSGAEPDVLDPTAGVAAAADYVVSVTPDGGSATWPMSTGGHTATFTVVNTGICKDIYGFSHAETGPISGVTLNKASASLLPGASTTVTATYSVGAPGTGVLTLSASGNASDNGSFNVTSLSNGPVISLTPHTGDYRDVAKCVANCFDAVTGYTTPPYFSWDAPHSVQLLYRSAQAKPMGFVQVDATDTTSVAPTKMSIRLQRSDATFVTFTNGSTEIFHTWQSGPNRLSAQFDAGSLTTGAYAYTVVVRSYRSDGSFRENVAPIRILIGTEAGSPFAAGWSIAGFQHLYVQADRSIVITEGNGSIGLFTNGCTGDCTLTSPKGDFTALTSVSLVGADSAKFKRRYPDGTIVAFYPNGRLDYVKDRFNNQTTFKYNASQLLVAIVDPAGKADSLGYDASNKLKWIKDPGGRTDSITVDASANLTRIKDWAGGLPFQATYDVNHRLIRWTDRRGGSWSIAYDFAGKLAADTAPQITVNGLAQRPVARYASLEKAMLVDPASGQGTSLNPGPAVNGSTIRASVTNAKGSTTSYALDRFGAPIRVEEPLGRTSAFTRDSNSHVIRDSLPSGHIIRYTWSGPNLTQRWDSTTGRRVNYAYEATYNQITKVSGDVDTVTNYWSGGHLDSSRVAGAGLSKYVYAANGRVASDTDAAGHVRTYHYQSSGFQNTDTVYFTVGKISYSYDGHGQRFQTTDQVNSVTTVQYDSIGRVFRTIGPLHDTTTNTYDGLYLTLVRDAKGQRYQFWPNALGWADSTTDPAGAVDRYQYDLNGNPLSWTNRRGQLIQFTYDSLDQRTSATADGRTTTFFTDPAGRYQVAANSESADTLRFDAADRPFVAVSCRVLVAGSAASCFRDSSVYELRDLRTQLAFSAPALWGAAQYSVGLHFDPFMRLDTLTNFAGQQTAFAYGSEGLLTRATFVALGNLSISYDYVWAHRSFEAQLSDTSLNATLGWGYRYDNAGRIDKAKHGPWTQPDTVRAFSYDSAGQLIAYNDTAYTYTQQQVNCSRSLAGDPCPATETIQSVSWVRSGSYVYDSVGNRKDASVPGGGLDPGNRLRRLGALRMDYDAAGNLLVKRLLNATDTTRVLRRDSLFWSALGRLDSVHTRDSLGALTRVGFGYDALGRRIRKSTPSGTSRYLWDGDALMMVLDSLGNRVAEYTYYPGTDNPHSVRRHDLGDLTYYYIRDNPGNVTALISGTGIATQYGYDPFGSGQGGTGAVADALRFAAREYDAETQLYYNRARYYDPAVGRFISADPLGLSAGINPYAYGGNDPANGRDPSGLCGPKSKAPAVGGGPVAAPPSNKGCGGGSSSDNSDIWSVVDAWFLMNYGFGLQYALNGTSGDCLFSGGGSIACSAGGFSYGDGAAAQHSAPGAWIFLRAKAFNHCNASSAYGNMYAPLVPSGDMAVLTYKLERVGGKRWVPGETPGDEGSFEAHYKGTVRLVAIWTPETQSYNGGIWVNCASNSGWFEGQLVP